MTHDELVRFAAEKVGAETRRLEDDRLTVFRVEISEVDGEQVDIDIDEDLTSPELLLKGLEVLIREGVEFLIEPGYVHVAIPDNTVSAPVKEIADLPLKFWTAWAELEGGQG